MASRPDYYSLEAVMFRAVLPSKDVLIIGPGSQSSRSSSIAHSFLLSNKNGIQLETVLVLIPEVFAMPIK
jgi:hypothetical protein